MTLKYKLRSKEINKSIHCKKLLKATSRKSDFTPPVNRRRPPAKAILLIDTIYSVMVRQTGVAGVLNSPDSDHFVIKLLKRTPTYNGFTPHVKRPRPPRKTVLLIGLSFLFKPSQPTNPKRVGLTYTIYKEKNNNSIEYSKITFLSSTRLTASSTRFTALGRLDRQHWGMRLDACKSPPSGSYGLCKQGIILWCKGIKMYKRSSPIFSYRSFSQSKTILEGSLLEPEEEEESTEKEAGPRIKINIVNNITINNNTNFNLFLDRLPNTIKVNGEVVDKTTHHILKKNNVFMPINGRFDGGVTKELEKLNFYQGKDLIALRNELLASKKESEKSIKGRQFFIKLSNPKINFESIDFPIDVFLGGRLSEMFDYLTNKYINKLFTSKKSISIVDNRKRSFIYKKNNFYENIVESKGKKTQKIVSRTEIGKIETLYVGHKKTGGLSSLIIYNKETKENEIEWEGILRIEAHIKADKMPIIDGFRRGEYNQQEMTRQIIKEIIRKFIEFKHPDNPSKIQKENLYRTKICEKWDNFLFELEKGTENMGTIDEHTLKNLLKKKEEKEYLFLDKEDKKEVKTKDEIE